LRSTTIMRSSTTDAPERSSGGGVVHPNDVARLGGREHPVLAVRSVPHGRGVHAVPPVTRRFEGLRHHRRIAHRRLPSRGPGQREEHSVEQRPRHSRGGPGGQKNAERSIGGGHVWTKAGGTRKSSAMYDSRCTGRPRRTSFPQSCLQVIEPYTSGLPPDGKSLADRSSHFDEHVWVFLLGFHSQPQTHERRHDHSPRGGPER
jgi:hypothetical protein